MHKFKLYAKVRYITFWVQSIVIFFGVIGFTFQQTINNEKWGRNEFVYSLIVLTVLLGIFGIDVHWCRVVNYFDLELEKRLQKEAKKKKKEARRKADENPEEASEKKDNAGTSVDNMKGINVPEVDLEFGRNPNIEVPMPGLESPEGKIKKRSRAKAKKSQIEHGDDGFFNQEIDAGFQD